MSPYASAIIAVASVSIVSLLGIVLLAVHEPFLRKVLLSLVSFSVGALLGNVFLHLLPEIAEDGNFEQAGVLILVGILLSFAIEQFIHWHHCHLTDCEEHVHPVGPLILIGDGAHNVMDGVLIATSFLVDTHLGIATTVAVVLHEIPQEIGDFAVLIHSGFGKHRAIFLNLFSALSAFVGVFLVFLLSERVEGIETYLLPLAAGNFLYIAIADLLPELHKDAHPIRALGQLLCIVAGVVLLYGVSEVSHTLLSPEAHAHEIHEEL